MALFIVIVVYNAFHSIIGIDLGTSDDSQAKISCTDLETISGLYGPDFTHFDSAHFEKDINQTLAIIMDSVII